MIRSELWKVRSVRSLLAFPVVGVLYAALAFGPAFSASESALQQIDPDELVRIVRGPSFFVAVAMLVLGALVTAGEFRHGTMPATLLVVPRRRDVLGAKSAAMAAIAGGTACAVAVVSVALGALFLRTHDIASTAAVADVALAVIASLVVPALYALAGVGLGLLARDQTVAVGAALLWIGIVEGALPVVLRAPSLYKWLPGGAANAVLGVVDPPDDLLPAAGAVLLLVAVVAGLMGAGWARFVGRDV